MVASTALRLLEENRQLEHGIEQLRELKNALLEVRDRLYEENMLLRGENEWLRSVLKFYADFEGSKIFWDQGAVARQALIGEAKRKTKDDAA